MAKVSNRTLLKYHKQLGLFVALLTFILALTGLALQHTDTLKLDQRYLTQSWLLSWYSYPEPELRRIQLSDHELLQVDETLLVNGQPLAAAQGELWGAAQTDETLLIGLGEQLYWLLAEGELIDVLSLPDGAELKLTAQEQQFVIKAASGWLKADAELEQWLPTPAYSGEVLLPEPLTLSQVTLPENLAVGVSVERLLLDLHSGRLFGSVGVLLMDLAAIGLMLLALTGCWVWLRKR